MKLTTTFWTKDIHEFNELYFINGRTKEVIFQTDLNDCFKTYLFFKMLSVFIKSKDVLKKSNINVVFERCDWCQFAVKKSDKIVPICWFDLIVNESCKVSHDIAFETTIVYRNNVRLSFGHFPTYYDRKNIRLPLYREFKLKARAYKYIANQIKKNLINKKLIQS